jgi:hypothetical protein
MSLSFAYVQHCSVFNAYMTTYNYLFLNIWTLTREVLNGSVESELFCWSRYLYIFVGSYTGYIWDRIRGSANRQKQGQQEPAKKETGGRSGQGGRQARGEAGKEEGT